jgi:hypothetical protein
MAHPASLLVNAHAELTGLGFPAHKKLVVQECSTAAWVVPAHPCTTGNAVSVTTSATGRFRASFTARICPAAGTAAGGTARTCYLGVPTPNGVDTETLVGAAKIVVSWP